MVLQGEVMARRLLPWVSTSFRCRKLYRPAYLQQKAFVLQTSEPHSYTLSFISEILGIKATYLN